METNVYEDRREAGRVLAERLGPIEPERSLVLALPRGGVVVADEICRLTGAPLELVLVRKLGLPGHEELAVGAIAEGSDEIVVADPEISALYGIDQHELERLARRERVEIERRRRLYFGDRERLSPEGRIAIVVDDGIATGATMRAALRAVRTGGAARVVCAVPLAPADTAASIGAVADEFICPLMPRPFYAVGEHYRRFPQVTDEEVVAIIAARRPPPS